MIRQISQKTERKWQLQKTCYVWPQQDYSQPEIQPEIIIHPPYFNFCLHHGMDCVWDQLVNVTNIFYVMYQSHAISHEIKYDKCSLCLSRVLLSLPSHWNHVTRTSILSFTPSFLCCITPWHLSALKSWGGKKTHLWCSIAKLQSRVLL